MEEGQFYPPGSRRWPGPGTNPPGPTWLPKGLADQGTGRLICPDLSLTAAYTRFSPRPWDVRWGRWVTCRGCLGRRRRAGPVCPFRAAVTPVDPTTPAMLPLGRPGVAGVVVRWAILCYPKEQAGQVPAAGPPGSAEQRKSDQQNGPLQIANRASHNSSEQQTGQVSAAGPPGSPRLQRPEQQNGAGFRCRTSRLPRASKIREIPRETP